MDFLNDFLFFKFFPLLRIKPFNTLYKQHWLWDAMSYLQRCVRVGILSRLREHEALVSGADIVNHHKQEADDVPPVRPRLVLREVHHLVNHVLWPIKQVTHIFVDTWIRRDNRQSFISDISKLQFAKHNTRKYHIK